MGTERGEAMVKEQRGAVIILFAAMIPFLMCFMGLVIDLGNMYKHYSDLQNAADAGAWAGSYAYAEEPSIAESTADSYVKQNHRNYDKLVYKQYRVIQENGEPYYEVTLKEKVPLYFLSYFPKIGSDTTIGAKGRAPIPKNNGTSTASNVFDNLFTASDLGAVNAYQNPDNHNIAQNVNNGSTYEGAIVLISDSGFNGASGIPFFNPKAFGPNGKGSTSVNDAEAQGQINHPKYDGTSDITAYYWNTVEKMMNDPSTYKVTNQNVNSLDSSTLTDLSSKGVNVIYYSTPNLDIKIDGAIGGDSKDPLYVICDNLSKIEFSGNMTSGRPIVLIYNGTGTFWLNCSGGTFTGDIYAPFGSIGVNENGVTFYGSIAAGKNIQLQGKGYYYQRNYTGYSTYM